MNRRALVETYYPMLWDAFGMFLFLGFELSALFILISFGVGLLQQYIPDSRIHAILSGKQGRGYIFAAALGAITPFCSCSTIPMLRGLLKAKAGFGPTMTFLFCSPLLNPIIIGLFVVTFGPKVTICYVGVALIVSVLSGFVLDLLKFDRYVIPESESSISACCSSSCCNDESGCDEPTVHSIPEDGSCCSPSPRTDCCSAPNSTHAATASSCCSTTETLPASCCAATSSSCDCSKPDEEEQNPLPSFKQRCAIAYHEATSQFWSVFTYLLVGVALGAFVYGFVPDEFIAKYAGGDNWLAIPIAAVIGIPLYVRAETLIPLSAALAGKGMGLGAIMALIIGGGGASITEVILLKSMFRVQMVAAFLIVILGMAVAAGYLFQYVF